MAGLAPLFRTAALILVIDQITKYLVVQVMNLKQVGAINVLDPYLNLRMAWNEGINFGIPLGSRWVLISIAVVICGWVILWMYREAPGRAALIAAGLIVGGAVGNVIDRIVYGAVADFLNMTCCGFENPWSFNVADISIFAGAIGLLFLTGGSKEGDANA